MSASQNTSLSAPWQRKGIPGAFVTERTSPVARNGYLYSFHAPAISSESKDVIHVTRFAGNKEWQVPFWIDGAEVVWIQDVAITADGHVVVAAVFLIDGSETLHNCVIELDLAGNPTAKIDLGDYEPELICSGADGTVWTFGQIWNAETDGSPSYPLLRNYSLGGQLKKALVSRADLQVSRLNLSARLHHAGGLPGTGFLECGDSSIGLYVGPALTWFEVQVADSRVQKWKVKLPAPRARITGLAILGATKVFGSFRTSEKDKSNTQDGLYMLALDSQDAASWQPVGGTVFPVATPQSFSTLIGSDGSSLVYLRNLAISTDGVPFLFWSAP